MEFNRFEFRVFLLLVFLALIAYAWVISKLQCVSSKFFFTISPNIPLGHSFNPLLHGLSAGVVHTMIFKFCAMSRNDWLLNSRPLLVRIDPGVLKYVNQCLNIALMMAEFSLQGNLTDTVSSNMVTQVKYFVTIDFFDIYGNIFIKIWS